MSCQNEAVSIRLLRDHILMVKQAALNLCYGWFGTHSSFGHHADFTGTIHAHASLTTLPYRYLLPFH